MRALTYTENGGPEVLHVAAVPEPHAGPGQVRVRVAAAGVNPIDWKLLGGFMPGSETPDRPVVPGFDAAGVVDEVGEGVTGVAVGRRRLRPRHRDAGRARRADGLGAEARLARLERRRRGAERAGDQRARPAPRRRAARARRSSWPAAPAAWARSSSRPAVAARHHRRRLRRGGQPGLPDARSGRSRCSTATAWSTACAPPPRAGSTRSRTWRARRRPPSSSRSRPSHDKVISIANFDLAAEGGLVTGGGPGEPHPVEALAEGADLLRENKIVIKVQTFPLDRAAEAYATSLSGHVRGKLVLLP